VVISGLPVNHASNPARIACRSHVRAFAFTYGLIKRL
jgi:hypothetical protein